MKKESNVLLAIAREAESIHEQLKRLRFVPLAAAAKLLGISKGSVRRNLPVVAVGTRTLRVKLDDIEAFVARRTINP